MKRYRRLCAQYVVLLLLAGCGTPESVRRTNALDGKAARWIAGTSEDPAVDRAAKSIEDGSAVIAREIGLPAEDPAYTPEAHEAAVVQANADLDAQEAVSKGISGWVERAVTKVADFVWPGLGGLLVGAWFWLRKKLAFDKLKQGTGVIVRALEKLPAAKQAVADLASKVGASSVVDAAVKATK